MLKRPLRNNRGVALIMAITSLLFMIFLATEVAYQTSVEYTVTSQAVKRVKAYYAAKSGVELSLLRIVIFRQALASFGKDLGDNKSMLDFIWNFPFAWPPSAALAGDISKVDRALIQKSEGESLMDAQYLTTIENEGSKLDINDLGSPSQTLKEATKKQLLQIFQREVNERESSFADKYRNISFEEVVNNMIDWVDADSESLNGGAERSKYSDIDNEFIPPNQPFKTLDELHMVAGMTDDMYKLLEKRVTAFGIKGIDINQASEEVLLSLDPNMTPEIVTEIKNRRTDEKLGGPFKNLQDFLDFIDGQGLSSNRFNPSQVPLIFSDNAVHNFKIISNGQYAGTTRQITAITYDLESLEERLITFLTEDENKQKGIKDDQNDKKNEGQNKQSKPPPIKVPEGRPRVVYWEEN